MGESNKLAFDPSVIAMPQARPRRDLHDMYLALVCFALAGYATFGKGFAYLGVPPLLVGEVTMLLGLLVVYRAGAGIAMLASVPSLLLAVLLTLVMTKAFAAVGPYGIDAIRDSVVVLYGLYAFAIIALLLEKPERLNQMLTWFGSLAFIYALWGGIAFYITSQYEEVLPRWPTSGTIMLDVRPGEAGVHLAGATVFVLLGMRKVPRWWIIPLIVSVALVTPSRGAMLSFVIPVSAAIVLGGKLKSFGPVMLTGAILFFAAYAVGLNVPLPDGRVMGPEQIVNNVESIVGSSEAANLDGTKEWRLRWWKAIVDYTFNGPYFWTGKGFGMGLAEADGFVVGLERGGPIVRSPHNAHLTMLARTGVPGITLWVLTFIAWFWMMGRNFLDACARGETYWSNIFLWVTCYLASIVIDASFDVAIEGPMIGIWFWSLFGLGVAVSMIYQYEMRERSRPQLQTG